MKSKRDIDTLRTFPADQTVFRKRRGAKYGTGVGANRIIGHHGWMQVFCNQALRVRWIGDCWLEAPVKDEKVTPDPETWEGPSIGPAMEPRNLRPRDTDQVPWDTTTRVFCEQQHQPFALAKGP